MGLELFVPGGGVIGGVIPLTGGSGNYPAAYGTTPPYAVITPFVKTRLTGLFYNL